MAGGRTIDVVGLGVSTLDFLQVVDQLPGEETVQMASDSLIQGGGPVATALVALARLGSRVAMIDKIGDDWRGRLIMEEFIKKRVAVDWIRITRGATSSMASILVRQSDGSRAITYSPGTAGDLFDNELPEEIIAEAKILHLNGRHFAASIKAAQMARQQGVKVSFDGGAGRMRDGLDELVRISDICIVARDFALAFTGMDDDESAAQRLLDFGPQIVVITSGSTGSLVLERGAAPFRQPAFPGCRTVDTTGAGDAFHGAFLYGILSGMDTPGCARLAAAVAAMNTRELGGRSALPTFEEALQFIENWSSRT